MDLRDGAEDEAFRHEVRSTPEDGLPIAGGDELWCQGHRHERPLGLPREPR